MIHQERKTEEKNNAVIFGVATGRQTEKKCYRFRSTIGMLKSNWSMTAIPEHWAKNWDIIITWIDLWLSHQSHVSIFRTLSLHWDLGFCICKTALMWLVCLRSHNSQTSHSWWDQFNCENNDLYDYLYGQQLSNGRRAWLHHVAAAAARPAQQPPRLLLPFPSP